MPPAALQSARTGSARLALALLAVLALGVLVALRVSGSVELTGRSGDTVPAREAVDLDATGTSRAGIATDATTSTRQVAAVLAAVDASPSSDAPFRIVGRVVDGAARGIPGATVEVSPALRYGPFLPRRGPRPPFDAGRVLVSVTTDADGRYLLPLEAAGTPTLRVRHAGYVTRVLEYVAVGPDPERGVAPIRLERGLRSGGVVLGAGGAPVAGAELLLAPPGRPPASDFQRGPEPRWVDLTEPLARTGADGRYVFDTLEAGTLRLLVRAEGYVTEVLELREPEWRHRDDVRISLRPGLAVAGRVEGAPVYDPARLEVWATAKTETGTEQCAVAVALDGRFSFLSRELPVTVESVTLTVSYHGHSRRKVSEPLDVRVGDLDVVVRLYPEVRLRFEPVDARSGAFLMPAEIVAVHRAPRAGFPDARSTVNGAAVELVLPGPVRGGAVGVCLFHPGYRAFFHEGEPAGESGVVDLGRVELEPLERIDVRVVDAASGAPVEGAVVRKVLEAPGADQPGDRGFSLARRSQAAGSVQSVPEPVTDSVSDADGRAAVPWDPGYGGWIAASAPGYAVSNVRRVEAGVSPAGTVELSLGEPATVTIAVRDGRGQPVPGVHVSLSRAGNDIVTLLSHRGVRIPEGPRGRRTDIRGEAVWSGVSPGAHRARLEDGRGSAVDVEVRTFEVPEGGEVREEFVFASGLVVEGSVHVDGTPVPGLAVVLVREGAPLDTEALGLAAPLEMLGPNARTTADGQFEIPGVAEGRYTLQVRGTGLAQLPERTLSVFEGMGPVDVRLATRRISGAVRDEAASIPEGARVVVAAVGDVAAVRRVRGRYLGAAPNASGRLTSSGLDADGRFDLRVPEAGPETALVVLHPTDCALVVPVPERASGATDLGVLTLRRGGSIVVDARAAELDAPARVTLVGPAGERRAARVIAGTARIDALEEGAWEVTLRPVGAGASRARTLQVAPGQTATWSVVK